MAVDGSIIFNTKMNTDGIVKGTKEVSSKMLDLKNKIANTESEISSLRQELEKMADTPISTNVAEKLEKDIAKAKAQLKSLYEQADKIGNTKQSDLTSMGFDTKYLDDMLSQDSSWQKVQKQIDETEAKLQNYERELKQVRAAESQVTGKDTAGYQQKKQKLEKLSGQLNVYKAKLKETEAKENSASKQTARSATNAKNYTKNIKSAVSILNSFVKSLKSVYARLKKAFSSSIANNIKKIGKNTSQTNKQFNLLTKSLQRIKQALAGLLLYKVLQGGIDGIKEGINNLAKSVPDVNKNLSALITSLEYLKNSLAAAFAPILNVITPILVGFIDTISAVIDKIGQFVAALTGQSTYTKAIKIQKDYAESIDDTTKSTEKNTEANQKNLAGYDELNVMQQDNSGSEAKNDSEPITFINAKVALNSFAEQLKNAIKSQNFKAVGQLLADKLNSALEKINWGKIKRTANKWAKNIAKLLNGFIGKTNWKLVGKTIAEGINTAITSLYTFAKSFDWKNLGSSISKSFNSFVQNFKWVTLGNLLADKMNIPIEILTGFVYTFDWKNLGKQIKKSLETFFDNLKLSEAGNSLGSLLEGLAVTAQEVFTSPSWSILGERISSGLHSFFTHNPFKNIISIVKNALSGLFDAAIELFKPENFNAQLIGEDVGQAINDFFSDEEWWAKAGKSLSDTTIGITEFLCTAIGEIDTDKIVDSVATLLSQVDWSYLGQKIGEFIFKGVAQIFLLLHSIILNIPIIGDIMGAITGINKDNIEEVKENFMSDFTLWKDPKTGETYKGSGIGVTTDKEQFEKVKELVEKYGDEAGQAYAKGGMDGLNKWIEENENNTDKKHVEKAKPKAKSSGTMIGRELVQASSGAVRSDTTFVDELSNKGKQGKNALTQGFDKKSVNSHFSGIWSGIQSIFSNVGTWFKGIFGKAWKSVVNIFSDGGGIKSIRQSVENVFKNVLNSLIDGLNNAIAFPFSAINSALGTLRNFEFANQKFFSWIPEIPVPQIPRLATGTVVPANYGEFLAVLGDNKRETEVVSPVSTMKQAFLEALAEGNFTSGDGDINLTINLDGEVIYQDTVKRNGRFKKTHGYSQLA